MNDDQRHWCDNASRYGGSFIQFFANACLRADDQNILFLYGALAAMMSKYPKYSEPVTQQ